MKSIRGTYENGTIKLLDPVTLPNETNVVITFLDDDFPLPEQQAPGQEEGDQSSEPAIPVEKDEKPEEYYEKLRKHKRYKARGNITIVYEGEELQFPLNDYSAGGLSFFSDRLFNIDSVITATLKYNASGEVLVMEFEISVRRIFEEEEEDNRFKVGCQFTDDVDEELWHTIMEQ